LDIRILGDTKLLELLCSETDDSLLYKEFVHRFLPDLKTECEKVCKARKLDRHIGIQISHEVLERVRKYKSFKRDKIHLKDDRKAIIVYLFRIAVSLFNDHHRSQKKSLQEHRTYFDDLSDLASSRPNPIILKDQLEIATKLFRKLNKNEQIVVLKDLEYKRNYKYLPDDVTESLAEQLGVEKDTIRKIRKRAIQKIKDLINGLN
jgi:DNA-directed RNA polymerase specialized sigma24 family protein